MNASLYMKFDVRSSLMTFRRCELSDFCPKPTKEVDKSRTAMQVN
jgi:hypothetical protein